MSKGMWTKHLTDEGKAYYFNASQNRSVWNPPPDSVVHEAPNLMRPGEQQALEHATVAMPSIEPPASETNTNESNLKSNISATTVQQSSVSIHNFPTQADSGSLNGTGNSEVDVQQLKNQAMILDIQAKIDQALQQHQKEGAKRFKKSHTDDNKQSSTYLQQKSEFESMAGSKGDEASKWLVR